MHHHIYVFLGLLSLLHQPLVQGMNLKMRLDEAQSGGAQLPVKEEEKRMPRKDSGSSSSPEKFDSDSPEKFDSPEKVDSSPLVERQCLFTLAAQSQTIAQYKDAVTLFKMGGWLFSYDDAEECRKPLEHEGTLECQEAQKQIGQGFIDCGTKINKRWNKHFKTMILDVYCTEDMKSFAQLIFIGMIKGKARYCFDKMWSGFNSMNKQSRQGMITQSYILQRFDEEKARWLRVATSDHFKAFGEILNDKEQASLLQEGIERFKASEPSYFPGYHNEFE
jgi:hypothetical protein